MAGNEQLPTRSERLADQRNDDRENKSSDVECRTCAAQIDTSEAEAQNGQCEVCYMGDEVTPTHEFAVLVRVRPKVRSCSLLNDDDVKALILNDLNEGNADGSYSAEVLAIGRIEI